MATMIRLQRGGRKKRPFYSIVVMDKRNRRDGKFIEKLGYYDPCKDPETLELDVAKAQEWIAKGADPSPRVARLIKDAQAAQSA
jgi:small subunit ribosomal protein S16